MSCLHPPNGCMCTYLVFILIKGVIDYDRDKFKNIKKSYGFNNILENISFEIKTGDKVGIIGDNGCGKSTILNIICNKEMQDSGIISIRNKSNIGYLNQNLDIINKEYTVQDIIYENVKGISEIEKKMKLYEKKMINNPNNINIINKYLNIQDKFINIGGYKVNTLIEKVMHGLNIDKFINRKFNELSGGEKKRVLLASLIIKKSNILILDEPTNHLDIETLEWLEKFLNTFNGTFIITSHDRFFLDKVTNKTILIEDGKAILFNGNYSYYLKQNELRIEKEYKNYKDQQKIICAMKKKIKQLYEYGKLAYPGGEKFFKRAESIRKRLNKLELINKPKEKKDFPINLLFENRSGKDVLKIKDYDLYIQNKLLIANINVNIYNGDKVCILGNNGCGKSTLIKNIINNCSDKIKLGSNIKIGYIPQQISFNNNQTILEYTRNFYIGDITHLRSSLDKFYFSNDLVFKKINNLSGGEKVRLKLFELINNKCNFIILDEITNHIDVDTKEILEESLIDFKGTVLFISHDRYFINKLANKVLYINNNKINEYMRNYDYFKSHKNTSK